MPRQSITISPVQEMLVLQFWAQAMDISRVFSSEEIRSIPGLATAIEAAMQLPDAIGWTEASQSETLDRST
jgi:hypothetical protein